MTGDDRDKSKDDRDKSKIDSMMDEMRSVGQEVAEGQFSIDRDVARKKMREFQLKEPWSYPLELLQAAILKGAATIEFELEPRNIKLRFDGRPFTEEDFLELYGAMFTRQDNPDIRARRQMAFGLNAVQGLGINHIKVTSGDGQSAISFNVAPDQEDKIEPEEQPISGTEVEIKLARSGGVAARMVSRDEGAKRSEQALRERGCYARPKVTVNGAVISSGLTMPNAVAVTDITGPRVKGVAGCIPELPKTEVQFVIDGVIIETHDLPGAPKSMVAVVQDPRFRKDLTQGAVVRDDAYKEALNEAHKAIDRVAGLLSYDRAELTVHKPTASAGTAMAGDAKLKTFKPNFPNLYLTGSYTGAARFFEGLKKFIRLFVPLIYAAPALIVAKLVLWIMGLRQGDWLTVGFVGFVVFFFFLLAIMMLSFAIVGPRSKRRRLLTMHLSGHKLKEVLAGVGLRHMAPPGSTTVRPKADAKAPLRPIRLQGKIAGLSGLKDRDRIVFADNWLQSEDKDEVVRLAAGRSFLLKTEGVPVLIDVAHAPLLLADYKERDVGPGLPPNMRRALSNWLDNRTKALSMDRLLSEGSGTELEEGDEVIIIASATSQSVKHPNKLTAGGHRVVLPRADREKGHTGVLKLKSTANAPLVIQRISSAAGGAS